MTIKGYIYITSTGYDPEHGKSLKDPYLGDVPTLGGCPRINVYSLLISG